MMFIGECLIRDLADLVKRNIVSRDRLLNFIIEREGCTKEEAEEIQIDVLESLEE